MIEQHGAPSECVLVNAQGVASNEFLRNNNVPNLFGLREGYSFLEMIRTFLKSLSQSTLHQ